MAKTAMGSMESQVYKRYELAAKQMEAGLCTPVEYNPDLLKMIPQEILERDYGCGDPSHYVREGDTVLDLGCGAGKICYIAAQIAGPTGQVIGVDFNEEMLALARRHQPEIARKAGYDNVRFYKAKIQDLATPLEKIDAYLAGKPVQSSRDLEDFESYRTHLAGSSPRTGSHCFGCTAGAGSSCGGALR